MKTSLIALAMIAASTLTSVAGPSWGVQLGNGAGFYWNGGAQTMPRRHYHQHHRPETYVVRGPQYYDVRGVQCGARVYNYSNAPLVIRQPRGGFTIQPKTW